MGKQEVTVVEIKIPFWSVVTLLLKWGNSGHSRVHRLFRARPLHCVCP
jgi:hypothetical protein